ncbi:MAG: hypothetical protein E7317_04060 [Clostridiales bacterium]|nr:hypothetical protein [Clostridiales bacterium]
MKKLISCILFLAMLLSFTSLAEKGAWDEAFMAYLNEHLSTVDLEAQSVHFETGDGYIHFEAAGDVLSLTTALFSQEETCLQFNGEYIWYGQGDTSYELPVAELTSLIRFGADGLGPDMEGAEIYAEMLDLFYTTVLGPGVTVEEGDFAALHYESSLKGLLRGFSDYVDAVLKEERYVDALRAFAPSEEAGDAMLQQFRAAWPAAKLTLAAMAGKKRVSLDIRQDRRGYTCAARYEDGEDALGLDVDVNTLSGYPRATGSAYQQHSDAKQELMDFSLNANRYRAEAELHTAGGLDVTSTYIQTANVTTLTASGKLRGTEYMRMDAKRVATANGDEFDMDMLMGGDAYSLAWKRSARAGEFRLAMPGSVYEGAARWNENGVPTQGRFNYSDTWASYYYYEPASFDMVYDGEKLTITDSASRTVMTWGARSQTRFAIKQESVSFYDGSTDRLYTYFDVVNEREGWSLYITEGDVVEKLTFGPKRGVALLRDADPERVSLMDLPGMLMRLFEIEAPEFLL